MKHENSKILVGSRYFFEYYPDFYSKDCDYVRVVNIDEVDFKYNREIHLSGGHDIFEIVKRPPKDIIDRIIEKGAPMQVGKFLIPEFCERIEFDFNKDYELLRPLIEKLDDMHTYEKIIYEAYIENGKMELTDEQRVAAYNEYKSKRKEFLEYIGG